MRISVAPMLIAATAIIDVSAGAIPADTSLSPLNPRQGNYWGADECHPEPGGSVIGGSTLWMLRNTWNNHFGGNFGGTLKVGEYKGICCWGQCLWVKCRGQTRSWSGDSWGDALRRLTNVVDDRSTGLCGAKINNDPYLILMSSQHDKVSNDGQVMGKIFGDTCRGNPPW
ncbi:hypothetical protein E8E12_004195 [Didymella heteroderae]|uniref:Uncharacterized protein n=1 Tax=Didymella heteroderae TaxID=1769908 RepID=A0A9P4WPJ5_9PLEO|nr:hypothetical protein E8E12_004195 [Didymella heteroderae]